MTKKAKDNVNEWFRKADHDLIAANKLIEEADILDSVCFHCQQAAEKYLKAFLIFKGIEPERTHNLNNLKKECIKFDSDFKNFDFKDLTHYASNSRYPDDFSEPSQHENRLLFRARRKSESVSIE